MKMDKLDTIKRKSSGSQAVDELRANSEKITLEAMRKPWEMQIFQWSQRRWWWAHIKLYLITEGTQEGAKYGPGRQNIAEVVNYAEAVRKRWETAKIGHAWHTSTDTSTTSTFFENNRKKQRAALLFATVSKGIATNCHHLCRWDDKKKHVL